MHYIIKIKFLDIQFQVILSDRDENKIFRIYFINPNFGTFTRPLELYRFILSFNLFEL